jgi:hypothetical protein
LPTKKLCNSNLWYLPDRSCCQRPKGYHCFLAPLTLERCLVEGHYSSRTYLRQGRKQVQNLFDKFKDPVRHNGVYGGYLLQINGPSFFDDNDLTRLQIKLLPFDVSNTAIPNSAPSFFKPWPVSKLKDHPVDVKAMEREGLEMLEIGDPFPGPSNPLDSAHEIQEFVSGHVPRANLGPGFFETLCDH